MDANEYKLAAPTIKKTMFFVDGEWLFRIWPDGKIEFNTEGFPRLTEDDFAKKVIKCLHAVSQPANPVISELERLISRFKVAHENLAKLSHVRELDMFEEGKYSTLELAIMGIEELIAELKKEQEKTNNFNAKNEAHWCNFKDGKCVICGADYDK